MNDEMNDENRLFTMHEVCEQTGFAYETLKFYCNKGLVPNVKRDVNNYRLFDARDIAWIKSLDCLKKCRMSIREMQHYLALCLEGEASIPERQKIIAQKRAQLLAERATIDDSLAFLDWKEHFYADVLSGKTKYFSNLLPPED